MSSRGPTKLAQRRYRRGRPKGDRSLVLLTFKADEATLAAIEKLKAALVASLGTGELTNGSRSRVIRAAILEAAARLDVEEKKT